MRPTVWAGAEAAGSAQIVARASQVDQSRVPLAPHRVPRAAGGRCRHHHGRLHPVRRPRHRRAGEPRPVPSAGGQDGRNPGRLPAAGRRRLDAERAPGRAVGPHRQASRVPGLRHLRRRAASGRHESQARSSPSTPIRTRRSSASPTTGRWPTCSTSRRNSRGCSERRRRETFTGVSTLGRSPGTGWWRCPSRCSPGGVALPCEVPPGPPRARLRQGAGAGDAERRRCCLTLVDPAPRPRERAGPHARLLWLSDPAGRHHYPGHPGRRGRAAGLAVLEGRLLPGILAGTRLGRTGAAGRPGRDGGQAGLVRPARLDYRTGREVRRRWRRYLRRRLGLPHACSDSWPSPGFALEGLRIADGRASFERWSPVGWALAHGSVDPAGMVRVHGSSVHHVLWWIHGIVALGFVAVDPVHQGGAHARGPVGVTVRDPRRGQGGWCRSRTTPSPRWSGTAARRLVLAAPDRPGRLHEVRQVPRGLPGQRERATRCRRETWCSTCASWPKARSVSARSVGSQPLHDPADAIVGAAVRPRRSGRA